MKNIKTVKEMIDLLNLIVSSHGGDTGFSVITPYGELELVPNKTIVLSNGTLVIDGGDWVSVKPDAQI